MNESLELLIYMVIGIACFTITYKMSPFKIWTPQKPKFTLFPKYIAQFNKPISEIESSLEKIQFKKNGNNNYTRGKVYADFSAKAIQLSVEIDEEKKQIKIYSSYFGLLFDTGDIWQVASEIINNEMPSQ